MDISYSKRTRMRLLLIFALYFVLGIPDVFSQSDIPESGKPLKVFSKNLAGPFPHPSVNGFVPEELQVRQVKACNYSQNALFALPLLNG